MDRGVLLAQRERVVLGYRKTKRLVATGKASLVVLANNCPAHFAAELQQAGAKIEMFEGNSRELGIVYGKPFNVSVLAIAGGQQEKTLKKSSRA